MFGLDDLLAEGLKIIDKYVPDGDKKMEAQLEMQKLVNSVQLANISANQSESATGKTFGMWRAAIGWVGAFTIGWNFVVLPFLTAIILIFDPTFPTGKIPGIDWKQIGPIIMGMLGLGS